MFLQLPGMAPVLVEYFEALNDRDLDRVMACVSADVVVTLGDSPVDEGGEEIVGHDGIVAWLRRTMGAATVTIVPLQATTEGDVTTTVLAVSVLSPVDGVATILQEVDYVIRDERIVEIQARPFRRSGNR